MPGNLLNKNMDELESYESQFYAKGGPVDGRVITVKHYYSFLYPEQTLGIMETGGIRYHTYMLTHYRTADGFPIYQCVRSKLLPIEPWNLKLLNSRPIDVDKVSRNYTIDVASLSDALFPYEEDQ